MTEAAPAWQPLFRTFHCRRHPTERLMVEKFHRSPVISMLMGVGGHGERPEIYLDIAGSVAGKKSNIATKLAAHPKSMRAISSARRLRADSGNTSLEPPYELALGGVVADVAGDPPDVRHAERRVAADREIEAGLGDLAMAIIRPDPRSHISCVAPWPPRRGRARRAHRR